MWDTNIWAPWGITFTTRDGAPILTETALHQLWSTHPETVEQVGPHEYWVYLDQAYRAVRHPTRAFLRLTADPRRRKPQAA
jgi:hypothetical protein